MSLRPQSKHSTPEGLVLLYYQIPIGHNFVENVVFGDQIRIVSHSFGQIPVFNKEDRRQSDLGLLDKVIRPLILKNFANLN